MPQNRDIPSFFDKVFHWLAWSRIAISPTLAFWLIGGFVYLIFKDGLGILLWIIITLIGLYLGALWANRVCRSTSPVRFMSQVIATPELEDESQLERLNEEELKSRMRDANVPNEHES